MRKMGMCPPCTLQEFYEGDPELPRPTHFMRGTADKIWRNTADPYGVMRTTAEDWTDDQEGPTNWLLLILEYGDLICCFYFILLAYSRHKKLIILSNEINQSIKGND
jgi:hypothetical protein